MKYKIIVINGPNLNLLGEREKEKYGNFSLKDVENDCLNFSKKNDMEVSFYQSNIEGELSVSIQESRDNYNGLIINAGGYTHTSVAIHDALKIIKIPIIENGIISFNVLRSNSFLNLYTAIKSEKISIGKIIAKA